MRVLVTGGAGFIGSHVCDELLRQGHDVVCMDNLSTSRKGNLGRCDGHSRFEFWRHDVCDPFHIECDRIYHLACPASPVQYQRNPVRTIKTAALGTMNALTCARDTGARLLVASTSEVYGDPDVHPQREDYYGNVNPIGVRACYDEGKRVGEALVASWEAQYGTDARIARIFNTYGPRMASDDGRMIPNFILQAKGGDPITIYGNGSQTRSWCYVSDTCRGLMQFMESPWDSSINGFDVPKVVNIGNPDERTVMEIAELIQRLSRKNPTICYKPLPENDPKRRCPDISRAKDLLGWKPMVSLERGLEITWSWFNGIGRHEERIREP